MDNIIVKKHIETGETREITVSELIMFLKDE